MARKLVSVDETTLLLPVPVSEALKADLATEFNGARDTAVTAASQAAGSAATAVAAAESATAPTDTMVSALIDTPSATQSSADARYLKAVDAIANYAPLTVGGKLAVRQGSLVINAKDYGATGNGSSDDTVGLQAAIDAANAAGGATVLIPPGIYNTSAPLTMGTVAGVRLVGSGRGNTWIRGTNTTSHIIDVTNAAYIAIGDLSITRVTRGTTGYGIRIQGPGEAAYNDLFNLHILNQYRGIHATACTFGYMRNIIVEGCLGDGIFFTNIATSGAIQWELSGILSQRNGGNGLRVFAQNLGVAQITMGTWRGIYTFGNSSSGIRVEGTAATPVYDFRLSDFFIGEDGDSEIYLETFGGMHIIGPGMIELCGKRTTGPTLTTPASNAGYGILIGSNNVDVTIGGPMMIWSNSYSGIYVSGGNVVITGVFLKDNGQTPTAGIAFHCGLYVAGGDVLLSGSRAHGSQYGAYSGVDAVTWVGNRLRGSVAGTGSGVALTTSVVANNRTV